MRLRQISVDDIVADSHFLNWCVQNDDRGLDAIHLHTSIEDYETKYDTNAYSLSLIKMARNIHRKYVSQRTGSCDFLDESARSTTSKRIHEILKGKPPYRSIFEPLKPSLTSHLINMHSSYLESQQVDDRQLPTSSDESARKAEMWYVALPSELKREDTSRFMDEDEVVEVTNEPNNELQIVTHDNDTARGEFVAAICDRLVTIRDDEEQQTIENKTPPRVASITRRFESLVVGKGRRSDSSGICSDNGDNTRSLERRLEAPSYATLPLNSSKSTIIELFGEFDAPMVAVSESKSLTFKDFRRFFCIPISDHRKYFFKCCDDSSTPASYFWMALTNDDTVLPIYQSKISAMCRECPPN